MHSSLIWLCLSLEERACLFADQAVARSAKRRMRQFRTHCIAFELDSQDGAVSHAIVCIS